MQSQEKKAGDRLSVPNIEESMHVGLEGDTPLLDQSLPVGTDVKESSAMIVTDEEDEGKRLSHVKVRDASDLEKRGEPTQDASKEVRSLLEYLYLDVKVRSPAEVWLSFFSTFMLNLNLLCPDSRAY